MSDTVKAAIWMIGAIISFSSMAVAGRELSSNLDTFEIMLFRSLIGLCIVLIVSSAAGTRKQINTRNLGLHLVRNVSHFAGQNLWFFAIVTVPLAQVFALEFTSPLWVMVLAAFILGEKLTWNRVLTGFAGFAGILIVAQPWSSPITIGVVTAALAAIGFAGSAVFTRLLTRKHTITTILFWLTAMQSAFGLICAGYDGDIALPLAQNVPWIFVVACAGLLAHFSLTKALSLASATVVIPVDFGRLPVIVMIGVVLYDEPASLNVLIGAVLIFASNYANILIETRKKP